jgi:hypothetical protein
VVDSPRHFVAGPLFLAFFGREAFGDGVAKLVEEVTGEKPQPQEASCRPMVRLAESVKLSFVVFAGQI